MKRSIASSMNLLCMNGLCSYCRGKLPLAQVEHFCGVFDNLCVVVAPATAVAMYDVTILGWPFAERNAIRPTEFKFRRNMHRDDVMYVELFLPPASLAVGLKCKELSAQGGPLRGATDQDDPKPVEHLADDLPAVMDERLQQRHGRGRRRADFTSKAA